MTTKLIYITALLYAVSFLMVLIAVTINSHWTLLGYSLMAALSWAVVESFKRFIAKNPTA